MYTNSWHRDLMLSAEARVDRLPTQQEVELSEAVAGVLRSSGEYLKSFGLGGGAHYRKAADAGCYHLRLDEGRAFLHRDAWDPRRHPFRHLLETPELVVGTVALALVGFVVVAAASGGGKEE